MPHSGRPGWPSDEGPTPSDSGALDTLPDRFGSDLAHLFDYCRALMGQDAEAARTARSVLDSAAHEPFLDRGRLRAWLFGLARSLAVALRPPGDDEPSYLPTALIAASDGQPDNSVLRAFRALTNRDREILDLVYRHGIRPGDLPAVLILPAEELYRCLANAEGEFISLAAGPDAGSGADLEDIAALPLAAMPAAAGGERRLDDRPASRLNGAGSRRQLARRRVRFAVAAVVPIAVIVGLVVFFVAPGQPAASPGAGVTPGTHGSPHAGRHAKSRHSQAPGQPAQPGPVASPTAMPEPTSSLSNSGVTGLAATVKPVPCPLGTKANFRWHYSASGSPGGWSGTATDACPGSVTMGPQAIGGNFQLNPGATLQAGYDFTLPGNNESLTMTVSAAQVTFAVSCVSKAVPSAPTVTVPLRSQTYRIIGAQWYPSGDQSSPLVYEGSTAIPALCGPAGQISLAKGGTFTATLS